MTAPPVVKARLERIWGDDPGSAGFLKTVDHKRIGRRYLITAMVFFLLAGIQALLIRGQLAVPDNDLIDADLYNQLFTMHGTTMIFLFNTPVLIGFGNYLMSLQLGARDMAMPRVNALSYWIYLFSGAFIYASYFVGAVPDSGWFSYVPLTDIEFNPGMAIDFWGIGVVFLGISTTIGGINFIVSAFKLRAPGMTFRRLPIFSWAILVTSFLILFSLPAITLGPLLLELDRLVGTAFYDPGRGGDPLLYQHLFWFWGHPEVYILFLPGLGMVGSIVPVFARRKLLAYSWVVAALVSIGFISFGVWVHHMFATGLPDLANMFFSVAGFGISIPTAVAIFAYLGTIRLGRPRINEPPMLYSLGFVLIFVLGGVTGVMVSVVPFDLQAHDSYFVVAHLHYVLIGGVVFPVLAAMHFWVPKITGWMMDRRLGRIAFWFAFVGFNLTFFPQHIVGLMGMPRRVFTYQAGMGWEVWNILSTIGAVVFAVAILIEAVNLVVSRRRRVPAGPNPWDGHSLEWSTSSPPPEFNFAAIPVLTRDAPLWAAGTGEGTDPELVDITGITLAPEGRSHETVQTEGIAAALPARLEMPPPTTIPFWLAVTLTVISIGAIVQSPATVIAGLIVVAGLLLAWHATGLTTGAEG